VASVGYGVVPGQICSVSAAFQAKQYEKLKGLGQTEAQAKHAVIQGHYGYVKGSFPNLEYGEHVFDATYGPTGDAYKILKGDHGYQLTRVIQGETHVSIMSEAKLEELLASDKWAFDLPGGSSPISEISKSVGNMSDEDVATMFVKTKDEIAKAKNLNIKGVNPELDGMVYDAIAKEIGYTPAEVKAKIDAYKADGHKLSALKKKVVPKTAPTPNGVPIKPTVDAVHQAAEDVVQHIPAYMDEDVAKAYIKAKDQIAADPDNPWTLYTQNNEAFDQAIYKLMEQSYGIHLPPETIRQQISDYLGGGNKLSVLKKKMAKTGEYTPQAPTLKAKKGDPTGIGKTSKTQAQQDISNAAQAGYHPNPNVSEMAITNPGQLNYVFEDLKNSIFAGMSPEHLYDQMWTSYLKFQQQYPHHKASLLDYVRAYDKKKAAQLGIENGFFYEKKVVEYASSPTGQAKILAQKAAKDLEANLPPLPADSADYRVFSTSEANAMQRTLEPWTAEQQRGLTTYTGGSYRQMNQWLRGDRAGWLDEGLKKAVHNAQAGMRSMPRKVLVHRGCDFQQFGLQSYEQALQLVGKTVQDKGFLSTSVGGRGAFSGSVQLEVELPVGTSASYIQSISSYHSEKEMLIAAGTKYEVLSVSKSGYQTTVRIRAIPGSHTKGL